ncbi:SPW repeat protein [Massilia sp. TS11]|uniref:SPW repeat protein n=1 Tax=Massilia sp. TS11 TaxID=2908003 RepID=UPI001EDB54BB|nr:SPW repeat protein [Massilia sp. TS11]MCG2585466.1 SPW repeat protein [Massilia sp. TS11]
MAIHFSTKRWQDQVILLLGLWLFVSPWAMNIAADSPLAMNAHVSGLLMAILAAFDLYSTYLWAVLLNMAVGVWTALSPWALRTTDNQAMVANAVIVGVAVVVLGLWELQSDPELHQKWAGSTSG